MMRDKRKRISYVILTVIVPAFYIVNSVSGWTGNQLFVKGEMAAAFVLILSAAGCLAVRQKWERETAAVRAILLLGMTMRIGYMLYTGCNVRAHDLWGFERDSGGHAGYILTILQTGKLPETNYKQYYQQPFFYLSGSLVSILVSLVTGQREAYYLVDAAKIISCIASGAVLLLGQDILSHAGASERAKIPAMLFLAFCPAFYLTGGRVASDSLNTFFLVLNFYYTLLWMENQSWKNTIVLAFGYGFGMMTKISCGVMALFTTAVFVRALWREDEKPWRLLKKYLVFGGISFPLGLWYAVRNLIKFGQSFTYVLELSKTQDAVYCGNHSMAQRFFSVSLKNIFATPYAEPRADYNFPVYLLKTSLFGEFRFDNVCDVIPVLLLFFALGMAALTAVALWWILGKCGLGRDIYCAAGIFVLFLIMGVWFCIRYPFGCSMDFRYMTVLIVPASVMLASFFDGSSEKWKSWIWGLSGGYSLFSCLMYFLA